MSQEINLPLHCPPLTRSVEVNRLHQYFDLIDTNTPNLPVGSTVLFEWSLNPFLSVNHVNNTEQYLYQLGYVVIRDGGVKDFVYEDRFGDINILKTQFTVSFI